MNPASNVLCDHSPLTVDILVVSTKPVQRLDHNDVSFADNANHSLVDRTVEMLTCLMLNEDMTWHDTISQHRIFLPVDVLLFG